MSTSGRPRIGLALGGGGARGLAHIGVLTVLCRAGIPFDLISGTSMGGILAAAWGIGLSPEEMRVQALEMSKLLKLVRLADIPTSQHSLVGGRGLRNFLAKHIKLETTFDQLRLPVAMAATDIRRGRIVVLNQGSVIDAAMATSAFPAVFPPIKINAAWLADGGILNNVPVDIARQMGAERVIAVDVIPPVPLPDQVTTPESKTHPYLFAGIADDIYHSMWVMVAAITAANLRQSPPDVLLLPPVAEDIHIFTGFRRAAEAIAAGEQAAEEALPKIKALLE